MSLTNIAGQLYRIGALIGVAIMIVAWFVYQRFLAPAVESAE
ncbi:MAG: hypothetical protein ABI946_01590 [Chthoniobacterales bacterium]